MTRWRRGQIAAVATAIGLVAAGCSGGGTEESSSASQEDEGAGKADVKYPADGFGTPAWQAEALSVDDGASAEIYDDRVVRWGGTQIESRNPDGSVAWELNLAEQVGDDQSFIDVRQMSGGLLGLITGESVSPDHTFLLDAETGKNLQEVDIPDDWEIFVPGTIDRQWGLPFQSGDDDENVFVVNSDGSIDKFAHLLYATGESVLTLNEEFGDEITWHPTGARTGKATTYKDLAGASPDRVAQLAPRFIVDADTAVVQSGGTGESAAEMIDFSKGKRLGILEDCNPDNISDVHTTQISPNGKFIAAGNALWEGTEATCLSAKGGPTAQGKAVFDDGTVIANDYTGHGDAQIEDFVKNPVLMLKDGEVISEFDNAESDDGRHQIAPKGTLSSDLVVYASPDGGVVALPRK